MTEMIVLFEEVTTVPLRKTKTSHLLCTLLSQQYKAQSICKQMQFLTELNVIDVLTKMHLRQFWKATDAATREGPHQSKWGTQRRMVNVINIAMMFATILMIIFKTMFVMMMLRRTDRDTHVGSASRLMFRRITFMV